jgi:type 1 glutamine amidotransferase
LDPGDIIKGQMKRIAVAVILLAASACSAADRKLAALVIDGMNNHDWAAGTRAIQSILEGSGRFTVDVCTFPAKPDFSKYDVVINNFNGGHTATGTRWPRDVEQALDAYVKNGGGLVVYHAANNAFLNWPEYNEMIGLGWRDKTFGDGIAIGPGGAVVRVPKGEGLDPGHGPRHDFEVYVRDTAHPITRGLPAHWLHPSEQLTHGQHGPAQGLDILTYAFSEVSHQGEPMDWVKQYGRGRVYTTMLGHTWKDELSPNLDDVNFQALVARGAEWAATGKVTIPANVGWRPLFDGNTLGGWEPRGDCLWSVLPDGALLGKRTAGTRPTDAKEIGGWLGSQAWLYTKAEYREFDLHVEYWIPAGGNSGVSIRDRSRAHGAIGERDSVRPELAGFPKTTPAHIGYEIQIIDDDAETYPSGSVYTFVPAKIGVQRHSAWNSLEIESRDQRIRVRLNGQIVAESPGEASRSKVGPIGLQLHDRFSTAMFRNIRIREMGR